VFDTPLLLLSLYHMIEWLRATIMLTVVCIGVNLMIVWYATILNSLFGLVSYIFAISVAFSEEGKSCSEAQSARYKFLIVDIIIFFVTFFFFSWPIIVLRCKSKQSHEKTLRKSDDDEEESD